MKPRIVCAHDVRLQVLETLINDLPNAYDTYLHHRAMLGSDAMLTDDIINVFSKGIEDHYDTYTIRRGLEDARRRCAVCAREKESEFEEDAPSDSNVLNKELEKQNWADEVAPRRLQKLRKQFPALKNARQRASIIKSPRWAKGLPQLPIVPLEDTPFELVPRDLDVDFDDYFDGPTLEELRKFNVDVGYEPALVYMDHRPTFRSQGEWFIDWGYRLLPEFAHMFASSKPQKVKEHILPVWKKLSAEEAEEENSGWGGNVKVMGMKEMLDAADKYPGAGVDVFVKGRLRDGTYIKLDPTRDDPRVQRKQNNSEDLGLHIQMQMFYDIDSIIITAHAPRVLGDMEVFVLPYSGKRPPIWKSNHTYVSLLQPQSEEDQAAKPRQEWFETRHSPSQLPHTYFGILGKQFDVTIMFPRMKHINVATRRHATLIPWEIQCQFLVEVLYPAVFACCHPGQWPYVNYTIDQWKWKASADNKFSGKKSIIVEAKQFHGMIEVMRATINGNGELSHFGSFFFVMEAKGIKHRTLCKVNTNGPNPYEVLCSKFNSVDFDALMERENGQVLMDLGLSYHPSHGSTSNPASDSSDSLPDNSCPSNHLPLVCLWNLCHLNGSYDAAGFNQGTIHHTNTMAEFGGRQAEMQTTRASLVQICFRSSYGLYYEPVRRVRGGEVTFCDDADAYYTNEAFFKSVDGYHKMLQGASCKTYGVRDEIRGSGAAIRSVLNDLPDLVSSVPIHDSSSDYTSTLCEQMHEVVKSDPFLLVPSDVFFRWLARRLLELRNVQLALARARPSNYGVTTAIIMHLIRHICHSPIIEKDYLRDALRDVRFEEVRETFGMFFLHDLDMDNLYITEIIAEDPPQCRRQFESYKNRRANRFVAKVPPAQSTEASAEFPLGRTPSYHDLQYFLANSKEPWTIFRDWQWVSDFDQSVSKVAADLFIMFTREFMNSLRLENLRGGYPNPKDLAEAMETWTVKSICLDLVSPHFVASNYRLAGTFKGPRDKAPNHLNIFFPREKDGLEGSHWGPMLEVGYLREYFQFKATKAPEDFDRLRRDIQMILNELQCIPISLPPGGNVRYGKLWVANQRGLQMWTNSTFYKLVSISAGNSKVAARNRGVVRSDKDLVKRLANLNEITLASKVQERRVAKQAKQAAQQQEWKRKKLEREKKNAANKVKAQLQRRSGKRKNKRAPPRRKHEVDTTTGVASPAENNSTNAEEHEFDHVLPSSLKKRRVVISTEDEDDFLDAGVDPTQGIITDESTEQQEIDNVESYLGHEEEEEDEEEEEEEEEEDEDEAGEADLYASEGSYEE